MPLDWSLSHSKTAMEHGHEATEELALRLMRLQTHSLDLLRQQLTLSPFEALESVLQDVRACTKSIRAAPDLAAHVLPLIAVVQDLSRSILKHIAVVFVSTAAAGDVAPFVEIDANVEPLLELIGVFADRCSQDAASLATDKQLLRWVPFALFASSFIACEQLPGAEMMRSFPIAHRILQTCQDVTSSDNRASLLARYLGPMVSLASQCASKDEWVQENGYPKLALWWILEQVAFPRLGGDLLGRLLALIFPLIDDLKDSTQRVGAQMLLHVARNVTSTELQWYTDVLLEVLRVGITTRKPETLDLLLQSLVVALDKVSPPQDFTFYDRFVPRLLTDTSLSSDVPLRIVYLRNLRPLVQRLGAPHSIYLIRYLQPLLKVLLSTFESINVALLLEALQTLETTIRCAWPRIAPHTEQILVGVLRAVAYCELFEASEGYLPSVAEKTQILTQCETVILLLYDINQPRGSRVTEMLQTVASGAPRLAKFCQHMTQTLVK